MYLPNQTIEHIKNLSYTSEQKAVPEFFFGVIILEINSLKQESFSIDPFNTSKQLILKTKDVNN